MNKIDFINKLFVLYPKDFTNEETKRAWVIAYDSVLSKNYEVNYDKLLKIVLLEHKSKNTAPSPAFLAEYLYKCKVHKQVSSGDEITLKTKIGVYTFTKVDVGWKCPTIKSIEQEMREAS